MISSRTSVALVSALLIALPVLVPRDAAACGCLAPPIDEENFVVNQQAEQIIFEVEPGFITAHVLIQYAGDPAKFAWLVPVPTVPEFGITPEGVFGLLDAQTGPIVNVTDVDLCPESPYFCRRHPEPLCGGGGVDARRVDGIALSDGAGVGGGAPPVDVRERLTVGDYDVVVFASGSGDARDAIDWLQAEGFIVNDSMAEYMTPYVVEGMLFVAAKLVPGADAKAIRPLRMRFAADEPMIPLRLTAVAAEPHMTITAYVYADGPFAAHGKPTIAIAPEDITRDSTGRTSYPMVLARTIDRAGGDGFVTEYAGRSPRGDFGGTNDCCDTSEYDRCNIERDGVCSCPTNPLDAADCAPYPGVIESATLMTELADRHRYLTRLTTRLSPEEMRTDPMFRPVARAAFEGRLTLDGERRGLDGCAGDVLDQDAYRSVHAIADCATVYCGAGTCATTEAGPGCACDAGFVARRFLDLDGLPSLTCVPETPPVDLAAGGITLPDGCAPGACGEGLCVSLNGVPHCACDGASAAILPPGNKVPLCVPATAGDAGAVDYTRGYEDLAVCAPGPPACAGGWLERRSVLREGVDCGGTEPAAADLIPPPAPGCATDGGPLGCGCRVGGHGTAPRVVVQLALGFALLGLGLAWCRRSGRQRER